VNNNKADLPYAAGAMRPVVAPQEEEETETVVVREQPKQTTVQPQPKKESQTVVAAAPAVVTEPVYQQQSYEVVRSKSDYPKYRPFNLIVKTNLVPWATVSPGIAIGTDGAKVATGSFMPNLELEYAFAGWGSVALGGTYSKFSYGDNPDNLWGVSALSLEPRLWFNDDGTYRGFNVGLRMQYGNFNVRDNKPYIGHGETGNFVGVSAMLNVVQPIYRNFAFEAGVGFGTRVVFDGYTYQRDYDLGVSEKVEKFSLTQFMINFRLSLLYRFGFH
jgi:hypothetical protein